MSSTQASEMSQANTQAPKSQPWHLDALLSSLFISGSALILAIEDPVNVVFEPRPLETIAAVIFGVALLAWANLRRNVWLLFAGAGVLLLTIGLGISTQPTQLNATLSSVWPVRIAMILLVASAWAFLLQLPGWARRGLLGFVAPTIPILLLLGGPSAIAGMFGGPIPPSASKHFSPYWLALNSQGTLYASDLDGGLIWVFDSSGNSQGTLRPGLAPAVGTPGPGIIPGGFETELKLPGFANATPTVVRSGNGTLPRSAIPNFDFCGIATDPQDNLYMIDFFDPEGYKLLRFDHAGNITARWKTPTDYQPTNDCIEADAAHIYLNSINNRMYVLDHNGNTLKQIPLPFQAFGISTTNLPDGKSSKTMMAVSGNVLGQIDLEAGTVVTSTLTAHNGALQVPLLSTQGNEVLLADHQQLQVVRVDASNGKVLGTIGERGSWPGQFGEVGGLAKDRSGRIYVADSRNRVIQIFGSGGKLAAVWWGQSLSEETEFENEER